ncbi:thioredoxin-like protein [Acaromyces ingoldii]|uniref:Thioredoxin-like protein n=1 Tax=Acaromyces ingoldii TaxID=215250 RepID=A0A316YIP2_9BASI|nr:thioredoxin-like protein [Acaromyces ingoldii]PWN89052.1 thioredoxin-like protein [Acaromyces ingoldii]
MTQYTIKAVSDIVCPFCYLGSVKLNKAIEAHRSKYPQDTFSIEYVPYYLQPPSQPAGEGTPAFPVASRNRREVYADKFGPERAKQVEAMLIDTAAKEGLTFKWGGKTGPSRNGHRLVRFAQQRAGQEGQNKVLYGLWRRYYEEEIDITELDVLVETGVEADVGTKEEVREYLESGKDAALIDDVAVQQRMKGISGVPNYVLQDRFEVPGAQDPDVFLSLFKKIKEL